MKKQFLLIILAVFLFSSCKKEEKDPEPNPTPLKTKTELLISSPWKLVATTVDPAIAGTSDLYAEMEACEKDDLVKYEANKTGIYDDGATKCDPTDPQTEVFNWTWDLTETKITEDGMIYDVIQLNETTLKSEAILDGASFGGTPGVKYKFTATFKH